MTCARQLSAEPISDCRSDHPRRLRTASPSPEGLIFRGDHRERAGRVARRSTAQDGGTRDVTTARLTRPALRPPFIDALYNGKARCDFSQRAPPASNGFAVLIITPGSDLLSHTPAHAVPSAVSGLTSVFGMGTGVTLIL